MLIRPAKGGLVMQQLMYADEVRPISEVPVGDAEIKEGELKLAVQLIEQIATDEFHPENYDDEVKKRYHEAIQRKIEGQEITAAPEQPKAQIIDLMEALKASLAAKSAAAATRFRPRRRGGARGREGHGHRGSRRQAVVAPGHGSEAQVLALSPRARHEAVAAAGMRPDSLARIHRDVVACERCPRLRAWCRQVAREKVRRFREEEYWGRPVPGLRRSPARLLIVGLAPAAHGGQPHRPRLHGRPLGRLPLRGASPSGFREPVHLGVAGDGLRLEDVYIAALVRCAPPANKPTPDEARRCRRPYLAREMRLFPRLGAILALGKIAMDGSARSLA